MTLLQIKNLERKRYKTYGIYYKKCLIYKLSNLVNGKVYVGLTTNLSKRFKSYLYHGINGRGQMAIHRAIKKYGFDKFDFLIIEEVSLKNLAKRETYWIKFFKSNEKEYGYNLTDGGENFKKNKECIKNHIKSAKNKKKVFLYNKEGFFLKEFESINNCAKELGIKHCTIVNSIRFKGLILKKYQAFFDKKNNVEPHKNKRNEKISKKLKNNRNCNTFYWKLTNLITGETFIEDGIRKLALTSGYKNDIITSIVYDRVGYKNFKKFLKVEKLHKYDKI
jgi:predicted GIY-YIG superfamily endonuclease